MCICYAHWDHSTEVFWAHLGIVWVRHHRLGYSFALHQCLHLACTKIGTSSLAPCRKMRKACRDMQSERWKLRLVMCNTMAYILLALCDLDLIRIRWMSFSEHSRQAHLFWGVALLTIAPDYTAFGSQRPKSRCLATMTIDDVLVLVGYLKF